MRLRGGGIIAMISVGREAPVRIVVMAGAAAALALLTVAAYAQMPGQTPWGTLPGMKGDKPKPEEPQFSVKADDKAYKSSLDAIPTKPKQAYDPWHNVRAAPQSNIPK
jgi:ethanolamine utilization microcompartment shell protein EutL